uniref:Uncharacterized protein n=1 Tax=Glossina palpalis gambiensis TaxID=67801 RepID=A0A1B0C3N0_9MUSC
MLVRSLRLLRLSARWDYDIVHFVYYPISSHSIAFSNASVLYFGTTVLGNAISNRFIFGGINIHSMQERATAFIIEMHKTSTIGGSAIHNVCEHSLAASYQCVQKHPGYGLLFYDPLKISKLQLENLELRPYT